MLARAQGWGWLAPIAMSATTFAGSAQFAALSVLGAGGTVAAAVAAALLLNARYGPIGVSVAPFLHGPAWSRLLRAQLVVDESWAIAAEGHGRFDPRMLVGAGLAIYVAWVGGTAVGLALGGALADPEALGLDAAFRALPRAPRTAGTGASLSRGRGARRGDRARAHAARAGRGTDPRLRPRLRPGGPPVSGVWATVLLVGVGTVAIKAVGPVAMGGRPPPARLRGVVELLAPAVLAALVAVQTLGDGRGLALDARVAGLAVAGVALWRRAPVLVVVALAAAATALTRLLV